MNSKNLYAIFFIILTSFTLKSQENKALPVFNFPDSENPCSEINRKNTKDIFDYSSDPAWKLAALEYLIECDSTNISLRIEKLKILESIKNDDLFAEELAKIIHKKSLGSQEKFELSELCYKTGKADKAIALLDELLFDQNFQHLNEVYYLKALIACDNRALGINPCSNFEEAARLGKIATHEQLQKCNCNDQ